MSSICCCWGKEVKMDYSEGVSYGAFSDGLTSESDGLSQTFGHHRTRSVNAPSMQSMDLPVSSLSTVPDPIVESEEVKQLKADLVQAKVLLEQQAAENKGLQAQLEAERKSSIGLAKMNKDVSFQSEERSQQLEKLRTELECVSAQVQALENDLQRNIRFSQQQVEGDFEKSREIERLKNKLSGRERDHARLAAELHEVKSQQACMQSLPEQSPSRRNSTDDRGRLQSANEELRRVVQELEQLQGKYTELSKHLRSIPVLEQKINEANDEFSQKEEELQKQVVFWKNKVTMLTARNSELTAKLVEAGVKGFGMHHRRSSSLTR